MPSIDGLITGIDTSTIIDGLLEIQKKQIDRQKVRQAQVVERQTAFSGVEARLLALRSTLGRLSNPHTTDLGAKLAVSSDEDLLTAAASESAQIGTYTMRITSLAHAHQIASQGFVSSEDVITQGTFQIQVGSDPPKAITIDESNNTLQGLVDAINASGADVVASLIQDGSATPYRLLLTSKQSGTANQIQLTNDLGASDGTAVRPEFDLENPVQAATDATVMLGSGDGAIAVSSATNQIQALIPGVTLHLEGADLDEEVTVQIKADEETAVGAVQEFVDAFNDLMEFVDTQTRFDPESNEAAPLLGDRAIQSLQDRLRLLVTTALPANEATGINPRMNRLSAAGISISGDGRLALDTSRLQAVLRGEVDGVDPEDVVRLFALTGNSNSSGVRFVAAGRRTAEATIGIDVTTVAEKATLEAGAPLAATTTIGPGQDSLVLRIDGQEYGPLTLTQGDYTPEELAAHLQDVIARAGPPGSPLATVSLVGGSLVLTSSSYGKASEVTTVSGTALGALGFSDGQTDTGQDVAGSFLVDGQVEAATGRGQVLVGDSDNEHTADLQVRVALAPGQLVSGPEAEMTTVRGLASQLDLALGDMLDPVDGDVKIIRDRFDDTLEGIQDTIDRLNARFQAQQESLVKQFAAMEAAVAELQSTSTYLAGQLANVQGLKIAS